MGGTVSIKESPLALSVMGKVYTNKHPVRLYYDPVLKGFDIDYPHPNVIMYLPYDQQSIIYEANQLIFRVKDVETRWGIDSGSSIQLVCEVISPRCFGSYQKAGPGSMQPWATDTAPLHDIYQTGLITSLVNGFMYADKSKIEYHNTNKTKPIICNPDHLREVITFEFSRQGVPLFTWSLNN